jgi:PAS domain S-box-containing protein
MGYIPESTSNKRGVLDDATLRDTEERLQLALRAARMVAWDWDPATGRVGTVGDLKGIYGVDSLPQVTAGFALVHPDDRERRRATVLATMKRGSGYHSEFRIIRPDSAQTVWVEERAVVFRDEAGHVVKMTGVVMDVTERRAAEKALHSANVELAEANDLLREQAVELEASNQQLEEQTAELEQQADELQTTAEALEERTVDAERALAALRVSEAEFRTLADAIPQLVWTAEPDGYRDWHNRRWVEYTGMTPAQVEGWAWQSAHHPEVLPHVLRLWRRSIATGEPFEIETALRGRNGEFRWFLMRAEALRDEHGMIVRWFGTNTDVQSQREAAAERERLLRQLDLERARLSDVFQQAPVAVAVLRGCVARDLIYELVNPRYEEIIPSGREPLGRRLGDVLPETDEGLFDLLQRVLDTGEPFVGSDYPASLDRDGDGTPETYYFNFVYHPLVEADGTVDGVIGVGVEVTESVLARRAAEELQRSAEAARAEAERARAQAEAADQAKSNFLATMSHEVRTPINAQIGYSQLLEMGIAGPLTEQQRDFLGRLRASSQHLLAILSEVLDLAKMDAGRLAVAREEAMTGDATSAALALTLPDAEAKGVRVVDDREGGRGVAYVGDENRVRQIVVNLLSNAVKFTRVGGTVTVRCDTVQHAPPQARVTGNGPWAYIRVEDTGIGIAPEHQATVFEPFHQVQSGTTRTAGGTGLGLTISRRLARLMGGDLTLESTPGVGSVFTLWLPATSEAEGVTESAAARGARAEHAVTGFYVHGLRELGVDLRERIEGVVDSYVARLRSDAALGAVSRSLARPELEDNMVIFLGNVAQALIIVGRGGGLESDALTDGKEIQRTISELHGRQRRRLGWTERQLARDYEVLGEELEAIVQRRAEELGDVQAAPDVVRQMLVWAREASARAYRHAARSSQHDPARSVGEVLGSTQPF